MILYTVTLVISLFINLSLSYFIVEVYRHEKTFFSIAEIDID